MLEYIETLPRVLQALLAGIFTWSVTALGAAVVFLGKDMKRKMLDAGLGFAAGIMIAASFWSLLLPSLNLAEERGQIVWLPATIGFLLGAAFLRLLDKIIPHLHINFPESKAEGPQTKMKKPLLLVLAITLHNLPEGLAVGVAFGSIGSSPDATFIGAVMLAVGIGIQNFPEGIAVALPLRKEGLSRWKSFNYGQLSALMEPIGAVLGALLVTSVSSILPYALAFAAGAMIFVVIEEVIPESQSGDNTDIATLGAILGFVMMILDTALS